MKHLTLLPKKDYAKLYFLLKDEGFSESLISSLRKDKDSMKINGAPANMRSLVKNNNIVEIFFRDYEATKVEPCDIPLEILFENEDILVVNKPSGLATIPSRSHFSENLAGAIVKYVKNENFVFRALGRLDKETSGVVIVAKNQYAAGMTTFKKTYLAICEGEIEKDEFCIDAPISTNQKDGINERKRTLSENGKSAKTFVRVLERKEDKSLLEISLEQGRTHQIRVHLASISHPLVGDSVYGSGGAPRAMLHAWKADIVLPNKEKLAITAPIPADFLEFFSQTNCH